MECPICYQGGPFFEASCGHSWCTSCQVQMRLKCIRICPLCRAQVEDYLVPLEPLTTLGSKEEPRIRWRVKRHRRRERRYEK